MTFDKIYIPTYRRTHNQLTWKNLPEKYRDITYLIVDEQDAKEIQSNYPSAKFIISPVQGQGIALLRKWIAEQAKGEVYWVMDDDIKFYRKNLLDTGKFKSHKMESVEEFDEMFEESRRWIEEDGILFGSLRAAWNIPNAGYYPYGDNIKIMTNVFYDGRRLPVDKIDWTAVEFAEDFDVALQLHSMCFKSRTSQEFVSSPLETGAAGGCSEQRTLERHNKSQELLAQRWPKYVKLKSKINKTGPWAGQEKLSTIIRFNKCYQDAIAEKEQFTLDSFMI